MQTISKKQEGICIKRKVAVICVLLISTMLQLTACSLTNTCKESGCDDEVYEDGYCKYHYYIHAGSDILKDIVN